MTWIMAAIDIVVERRGLDESHRFFVAMMPLGTGNDLARTFGWGGKFRGACLKRSWVDACRAATPAQLDRWLVSVMPSAEGQKASKLLDVPEVFSVHEFATHDDPEKGKDAGAKSRHSVLKEGRHHSLRMTQTSVANLVQHDAERRQPSQGGGGQVESVDSIKTDAFEATVEERASFEDRGEAQGRKRVIQRRSNVGVLEAIPKRKASTL